MILFHPIHLGNSKERFLKNVIDFRERQGEEERERKMKSRQTVVALADALVGRSLYVP